MRGALPGEHTGGRVRGYLKREVRQAQATPLGSIGVSLCLSSDSHAAAAAGARDTKDLEVQAKGSVVCWVEVESVLEGSPAHAAGIHAVSALVSRVLSKQVVRLDLSCLNVSRTRAT